MLENIIKLTCPEARDEPAGSIELAARAACNDGCRRTESGVKLKKRVLGLDDDEPPAARRHGRHGEVTPPDL